MKMSLFSTTLFVGAILLVAANHVFAQGYIYFISNRDGNEEIYRMDEDGSNVARITNTPWWEGPPKISADGTKILFPSGQSGAGRFCIMNVDGSNVRSLPRYEEEDLSPSHCWSPDGQRVVFSTQTSSMGIWVPSTVRMFTIDWNDPANSPMQVLFGYYGSPSEWHEYYWNDWSPDGKKVAHCRIYNPSWDCNADIYVYNFEDGTRSALTTDQLANAAPAWSPDGTKIAFHKGPYCLQPENRIYLMNADGTNPLDLSAVNGKPDNVADAWPRWSRDGNKIAFGSNRSGRWQIYVMNADGTGLTQLTSGDHDNRHPDFGTAQDTEPPIIAVSVNLNVLWPPNHKMVEIHATVTVSDERDPAPTVRLTSITSDEPDNGLGDGDTPNDIQEAALGTADYNFKLRAERAGNGDGRVYTVTYTATDACGNQASVTATVTVPHSMRKLAGANEVSGPPAEFSLVPNYPNPFNAETVIGYELPTSSHVTLQILNPLGQEIRRLVDSEQTAGYYTARWDGRDDSGSDVASGIYLYRIEAGEFIATSKMLLVR